MSLTCPACGAILDAIVSQSLPQSGAIPGANRQIAHGSGSIDLEPASKTGRSYNQGYDLDFAEFWKVYPLRRDKRKAQIAWRKSVARLGAIPGANRAAAMAQILTGAIRYRDDPNRVDQFTKYAEGWLNADGWEDEPLPVRTMNGQGKFTLPSAPQPIRSSLASDLTEEEWEARLGG